MDDGMLKGILESYEWTITAIIEAFSDLSGIANNIYNKYDWLVNIQTMLRTAVIGDGTNGWMNSMEVIAFAIALSFFIISIVTAAMGEKLTPEHMIHQGAKLALAVAGIMWSPVLLEGIVEFGDAFGNAFAGISTTMQYNGAVTIPTATNKWHEAMNRVYSLSDEALGVDGIFTEISSFLIIAMYNGFGFVFTILIIPIIEICMVFVQITRYIELYVRGTFLPIAMGVMTDEGWRGAGGRYIRKIMAVACQNAAVLMTLNVTGVMLSTVVGTEVQKAAQDVINYINTHQNTLKAATLCSELGSVLPKTIVVGIVVCVAGIAFMFKSIQVMDDLWGSR